MKDQNKTGIICDIDHFAVHDGMGIRTCVYVKGCPLHCVWCHSPESQKKEAEILFAPNRCVGCGACILECSLGLQKLQDGNRVFDREACTACGECVKVCTAGALSLSGKAYTAEELLEELLPDQIFYQNSGGGVTISGGEVLSQADFVYQVLKGLKEHQIHTIIETAGYGKQEDLLMLAEYTDIFYYDYKLGDRVLFREFTGGEITEVLRNLEALRMVTDQIVLRVPMIPGLTDTRDNISLLYDLAQKLEIRQIHLLPYNTSAGAKYEWCGKIFEFKTSKEERVQTELYQAMAPEQVEVIVIN